MAKGRPKNLTKDLPLDIQRQVALEKHKLGGKLTLDETALAIWDPAKEKKPMTAMGVQKIELRALAKLRIELKARFGINGIDDMFESRRGFATMCEARLAGDE